MATKGDQGGGRKLMIEGHFLRFYVREDHRHHHTQANLEGLLQQANKMGIRGGSAFHAMARFGRHHVLHEQQLHRACRTGDRGQIHCDLPIDRGASSS